MYCLSRARFGSSKPDAKESIAEKVPNSSQLRELAQKMKKVAAQIAQVEATGLLDAFEQRDFSATTDSSRRAIDGFSLSFIRALPKTLARRAEMYERWSHCFYGRDFRHDLLLRVNRLCLSVYVKFVANEDDSNVRAHAKHDLVVDIMRGAGVTADRSQLRRELRYFENEHFMAYGALRDKLKRLHFMSNKV